MGHATSKPTSSDDSPDAGGPNPNPHHHRIKHKLHLHHRPTPSHNITTVNSHDAFVGIALVTLISAEMKAKDKWLACVSIGEQTFRTRVSDQTDKPVWNSEKKFVLEKNGAHIAKVSVFETNRLSKNKLNGYCEIDLFDFLSRVSESKTEVFELFDPSSSNEAVGKISISCTVENPVETEKSFARRILSIVDYNGDGKLSLSEFCELIDAFGNKLAATKKEELFKAADVNGDDAVSMDELATLLALQQEKEPLINCCPVCGELLKISDKLNSLIHMSLCFDEGTGNQIMTGGFLTDKQASYGWMFKLSEWAHVSSYDVGLNSGSSASHIVVFDRVKKRLVEEIIDGKIILSMRAIYQSKLGLSIMDKGAKEILQSLSEKQGKKMNSVESAKDIPTFLEFFKDQINVAEVKYPLDHFKTFNEFFIRELKHGARPIACEGHDDVAVCAADSRLMAFRTAEESLRFWIKGNKFSIQGLLGPCSNAFIDGTLVIFRLAPQDYHRFHFPVSGTVEQIVDIPGSLYTVNPIAVSSKYCNVFTENKRAVSIISTADFGKVAFVAVGATMVGSITFTKKPGDYVRKGDEFGYFSFGGSTVICVFEKDSIALDEDLLANSARSLETLVSVGMQLGVSVKKHDEVSSLDINRCVLGS
ncbi:phosphatidylserine decarboxylase proenzyme 2-like [Bidens hawaiensis]|uniref:phosphatidylserine decarboxylase proenzyme 2-like n=1 Tax=Bidens hawaiensis TaxID=980011 RepID=UPI00404A8E35